MKVPNHPPRRGHAAQLDFGQPPQSGLVPHAEEPCASSSRGLTETSVRVTTDERVTSVRLDGFFRPAWMAGLCAGLSERGVSIQRVDATAKDGWWSADLQLDAPPGVDLSQIPYADLIEVPPALQSTSLRIERYRMTDSTDHGGTLRLEIDARDALGLLGQVLSFLAMLSLFPVSMRIETREGRAYDRFWLSGVGKAAPTQQSRVLLDRMLATIVGEPSVPPTIQTAFDPRPDEPRTSRLPRAGAVGAPSNLGLRAEDARTSHFTVPPWTAPLDAMAVVRAIPESATIAGMFSAALVREAGKRGITIPSAREHYLPFEFYPAAEHALLLVQAAQLFMPDKPLRIALRSLGRAAPDALLSSTLGRVVLGTVQGALAALEAIARTYAMNVRPSSAELIEGVPGRAIVRFRALPFFVDCHHVGVLEGTMRYAGVHGTVRIRAGDAEQADLLCTWDHAKVSRPPRR